ncbi:MAG: dTDP-4-dehydrorhamnose reductase [Solirubrobacteraceae bacterium]
MRFLITGAAGMLGVDVHRAARAAGHEVLALPRAELDLTDAAAAVDSVLSAARPEVVVNCAAWTDVDGAQDDVDGAFAVNAVGAGYLARVAAACGAWTIHISSDYVFDGSKREPYLESDLARPICVYGHSKLEGERAVARAAPAAHTIVRSSWLFGAGGPCFPATILRLANERDELSVVDDQVGCPTSTEHLAHALVQLAGLPRVSGIVHVAGGGECSRYELATEVVARCGAACRVKPGRTDDFPRPAPRPAYSVLGTEHGPQVPRLPHWREGLAAFLAAGVSAA